MTTGETPPRIPPRDRDQTKARRDPIRNGTDSKIIAVRARPGRRIVKEHGQLPPRHAQIVRPSTDAFSFLFSAMLLSRLRVGNERAEATENAFANLRQGWHEFRRRRWLWSVTVLSGVSVLVVYAPIMALGPVVARQWLGGVSAWAAILAAMGIGGIVAGAPAAPVPPPKPRGRGGCGSVLLLAGLAPPC